MKIIFCLTPEYFLSELGFIGLSDYRIVGILLILKILRILIQTMGFKITDFEFFQFILVIKQESGRSISSGSERLGSLVFGHWSLGVGYWSLGGYENNFLFNP